MKLLCSLIFISISFIVLAQEARPKVKKKYIHKKGSELKAPPKRPAKNFKEEHKHWVEERSKEKGRK